MSQSAKSPLNNSDKEDEKELKREEEESQSAKSPLNNSDI